MQSLQSLISSTVASIVRPAPMSPEKVLFAWRAAVGPALARVTRVALGADRVLEVRLDDDRFGDELVRSADVVLRRVQDLLGTAAVVRMAVRRAAARRPRQPRRSGASAKGASKGGS